MCEEPSQRAKQQIIGAQSGVFSILPPRPGTDMQEVAQAYSARVERASDLPEDLFELSETMPPSSSAAAEQVQQAIRERLQLLRATR